MKTIFNKISSLIIYGMISCPLLICGHQIRAEATAKPEDGGKAIVMQNESVRLVIDPERGGAVVSYVYDQNRHDIIQRTRKYMGLFMDHLWGQGWPGELLESPYDAKIEKSGPDEAVVKLWRTVRGDWGGLHQKIIEGLVIEKTFTLKSGSDALSCHVVVRNPMKEARLPAYWCQNVFFIGGDYDSTNDVFMRPSARGVKSSNQIRCQDDFLRDPTSGWSAAVDTVKGEGIIFFMDYNDLEMLYNCQGNSTLEWMYDKIPVPAGRSWETDIVLIPVGGFTSIGHASPNFIAQVGVRRDGDNLVLTHQLRASMGKVKNLSLAVKIIGANDKAEVVLPALSVGDLTMEKKSVSQNAKVSSTDPLAIMVTASGNANGKEFKEEYFYFFAGSYGYGDNVKQDLVTPLLTVERPEKKQELMRPDRIERVREAKPQVFILKGLLSKECRLDEALELFGADSSFGTYSIGQEGPRVSEFPLDYDSLLKQDVIIVSNANIQCLGKLGMMILRDYLTHGGNMLLLGGKCAFGGGGLKGSGLEDLLPVSIEDTLFDVQPPANLSIRVEKKHPAVEGIDWASLPSAPLYMNKVKAKNDAYLLLSAGDSPLLAVQELEGGGRIACFMAAPYGGDDKNLPSFYASPAWPQFMKNMLCWLSRREK